MRKHKLFNQMIYDWEFKFDNAKGRFGCCRHRDKIISISKHLTKLNDKVIVKDIILHEIAHALIGPGYGHGKKWKMKALEIGADGERCYGRKVIQPKKKFKGTCPKCKRLIHRNRKKNLCCGSCFKVYDPLQKFIWVEN